MSGVLKVNGTAVNLDENDCILKSLVAYRKGSYPTLSFERRGLPIGYLNTETWNGATVTLTLNGTLYFSGLITGVSESFENIGYVLRYQAFGLRFYGDLVPWTNQIDNLDVSYFNLQVTDPNYNSAQAGRTQGQILGTALNWATNSANLSQYGIFYTSLTDSDLAQLTTIPPRPIQIGGEKLLGAVEAFLANQAPNWFLWIQPDGQMRFLNLALFSPITLTLGKDLVLPPEISRDAGDCFQAVQVRGAPWALPVLCTTSNGGLQEQFEWGNYTTNAEAIAAWSASYYQQPGNGNASFSGTCVVASTTTVTVTVSSPSGAFWGSDALDQSLGSHAVIYLNESTLVGVDEFVSRRVIANTALTAGGTSVLTLDIPLNFTTYTTFQMYCVTGGGSVVWRQYHFTNSYVASHLANTLSYPVPFTNATGTAASLVTIPSGSVVYNGQEVPVAFTYDTTTGDVIFTYPVSLIYGTPQNPQPPDDVRVLAAVNTEVNLIRVPSSGFTGTSYTHEGLQNTLTVTIPEWTDPLAITQITAFADDLLATVCNTVLAGTCVYRGLLESVLMMGASLNIAANYGPHDLTTTGLEDAQIPIIAVELAFLQGDSAIYETTMTLSSRKSQYTADYFMKPQRPMVLPTIGVSEEAADAFSKAGEGYAQQVNNTNNEAWGNT